MIENSHIVNDTRKIRCFISDRFDNDADSYIDYLLSKRKKIIIASEFKKTKDPKIKNNNPDCLMNY